MRTSTDASTLHGVLVVDPEQPGLFVDNLGIPDSPAAEATGRGDTHPRQLHRQRPAADPAPADGAPLLLPIDRLDADPLHPREGYPEEHLDDLARDISERGMLQPIVVAPADAQSRYRIQFGVQRWCAARRAGLTEVPVTVRAMPCDSYDQVAENLKRHGLSPLELARFIRARVQAGESNAHIARKLAVDATTVAHHLSLLDLPPALAAALESGRCTAPRTLHELQRLHDHQPEAVTALLAGDLPVTRDTVAALRKSVAASSVGFGQQRTLPLDTIATLIGRSQTLCDRLDRLLSRLVDTDPRALPGDSLAALRKRLASLVQRLGA